MPISARVIACLLSLGALASAAAQEPSRKTIWDLKLGAATAQQPPAIEYRGFACGAKGGPPRLPLKGFDDFMRCTPEESGLREVYFEYDDELEYIARARDLERELNLYAGTTEYGYPIMTSALFDVSGRLRGLRLVTDSRPDFRKDVTEAETRKRENAFRFGGVMAARFDIDATTSCKNNPPGEGESPVGSTFIKLDCDKLDAPAHRRYLLSVRMLRKAGQSDRDPRVPSQLTTGQFESTAQLDIYATD
jgi:hypothetical protein